MKDRERKPGQHEKEPIRYFGELLKQRGKVIRCTRDGENWFYALLEKRGVDAMTHSSQEGKITYYKQITDDEVHETGVIKEYDLPNWSILPVPYRKAKTMDFSFAKTVSERNYRRSIY